MPDVNHALAARIASVWKDDLPIELSARHLAVAYLDLARQLAEARENYKSAVQGRQGMRAALRVARAELKVWRNYQPEELAAIALRLEKMLNPSWKGADDE